MAALAVSLKKPKSRKGFGRGTYGCVRSPRGRGLIYDVILRCVILGKHEVLLSVLQVLCWSVVGGRQERRVNRT